MDLFEPRMKAWQSLTDLGHIEVDSGSLPCWFWCHAPAEPPSLGFRSISRLPLCGCQPKRNMRGSTFIILAAICRICMVLRFFIMFKVFLIWWGSMTEDWTPREFFRTAAMMFSQHLPFGIPSWQPRLVSSHFSSHLCWLEPQWSLADVEILPYRVTKIVIKWVVDLCLHGSLWNQYFFNIFHVFFYCKLGLGDMSWWFLVSRCCHASAYSTKPPELIF